MAEENALLLLVNNAENETNWKRMEAAIDWLTDYDNVTDLARLVVRMAEAQEAVISASTDSGATIPDIAVARGLTRICLADYEALLKRAEEEQ